jgi:hypothetical protein
MLVSAPTMSSGDAGNTGVITSGGTKEGVLGERIGDGARAVAWFPIGDGARDVVWLPICAGDA